MPQQSQPPDTSQPEARPRPAHRCFVRRVSNSGTPRHESKPLSIAILSLQDYSTLTLGQAWQGESRASSLFVEHLLSEQGFKLSGLGFWVWVLEGSRPLHS